MPSQFARSPSAWFTMQRTPALRQYRPVRFAAMLVALFTAGASRPGFAQTAVSWANVGSTFSTGANWVGGTAPADNTTSSIATFGTVTVQPELTADRSVARLLFSGTTAATLSGSSTLTLGGTSVSNSSTTGMKTVAVPLKLPFRSTIENSGELTLSERITGLTSSSCIVTFVDDSTGAGSLISGELAINTLIKTGSGILTLTGSMSGTGDVTVSGGTLRLGGSDRLPDGPVTVNAGGTFDLAGWSEQVGDLSGAGAVTLGAGTLTTGSRSSTTFSGEITGVGGLVKTGAFYTFTLTGSNSFTGGTTIAAGRLAVGNGGTTGSLVGDVATSGTIAFNRSDASTYGGVISGTGSLLKQGAGQLTLTATHSYTGLTTIAGGTLALAAANALADSTRVSIATGAALKLTGFSDTIGSLTGTGAVVLGSGTLAVGAANVTGFNATIFYGSISGAGGLTKVGTGDFQLSGTNTYAGATTITGGTLTLRSGSALPATTPVVISAGATLYKPFTASAVAVRSLSGTGTVTLESGTLAIRTNGSSAIFAGTIDGGDVVKDGAGTQTITGTISGGLIHALGGGLELGLLGDRAVVSSDIQITSNLYVSGSTTIDSPYIDNTGYFELADSATITAATITGVGNLYAFGSANLGASTITNDNALSLWGQSSAGSATITNNQTMTMGGTSSAGSATITNNGTLDFREDSSAAGATIANGSAGVIAAQYATATSIGALSGGGRLTLGDRTVTIGARGTSTTFSGTISGTGGSLVKTGAGTLTLSAANTYSGTTTIAGGRLALTNSGSIGTGGLSLGSAGVFDLAGRTGGTYTLPATGDLVGSGTLVGNGKTLAVLGSFRPGNSPGTVTFGAGFTLDLANSGTSLFEITSPDYTAGTYDLVSGAGSVIFGGVLNVAFSGGTFADGTDVVQLFANSAGRSGDFSSVVATGLEAGQYATFNAATGFITVVPEPAGALLAIAGIACGGYVTWRRRSVSRACRAVATGSDRTRRRGQAAADLPAA
jgi:fibronectin-binding autotransporter adhesin